MQTSLLAGDDTLFRLPSQVTGFWPGEETVLDLGYHLFSMSRCLTG